MKQVWKGLTVLLLCLALLLCGCAAGETSIAPTAAPVSEPMPSAAPAVSSSTPTEAPQEKTLELWLAEDSPLYDALAQMAGEYAATHPEQAVELRRFASSAALIAALADSQPDLLLCEEPAAEALTVEGMLGALTPPEEWPKLFRDAPACAAGRFVPLGAEAAVLALREENLERLKDCDSMETLCALAADYGRTQGKPFFSTDSFAQLFACLLEQKGSPFFAMREQDLESESYREIYNLLAEAAFEGGLASLDEAVLPAIARGELVCGVCSSRALSAAESGAMAVLPLPPMAGCEASTPVRIWGLAVAADADPAEAEDFIRWLYEDKRAVQAALEQGLVPPVDWDWSADDAASTGLALTAQSCRGYLPEAQSGYVLRGAEFEQSFRTALALLG